MSTPLPFSVVIEQFAALREQANDEWHAAKAMTVGTSPLLFLPELVQTGEIADNAPLQRALRRFVKALPDEQLFGLLALIYAGRDGKADPVAYWKAQIRATVQSRAAAVEVVLEKEPAAQYIRQAVVALAPGRDLDSLPSLVMAQT